MTPVIGVIASSIFKSSTAYESIATILPSVAPPASTYTFSSIPQTYKSLQLRWTTVPQTSGYAFYIRFNGVATGGQYTHRSIYGRGNSQIINTTGGASQNEIIVSNSNGGTIANQPQSGIIDLLEYTNTSKVKVVSAIMGMGTNNGGTEGAVLMGSGVWNSTAAITSITFAAGINFISGSLALYGIKG